MRRNRRKTTTASPRLWIKRAQQTKQAIEETEKLLGSRRFRNMDPATKQAVRDDYASYLQDQQTIFAQLTEALL